MIIDLFETWSNECTPFDNDKQWKIVIEDDKVTLRMLRYKDPSILTLLESRKCGYVVSFFEKETVMTEVYEPDSLIEECLKKKKFSFFSRVEKISGEKTKRK